jgi:hypothetical protein
MKNKLISLMIGKLIKTKWRIAIAYSYVSAPTMGLVVAKTAQDILKNNDIIIPFLYLGFV